MTTVMSSLDAGAEMITFLAPPSMWARALAASVKKPVDSTTMSAPRSPHFRADGSRSANAVISWSPTLMEVSVEVTSASRRPRMESNFSRWARDLLSVRSLTPTISMSAPEARTARKKLRPMRPKPLIPTRTVTAVLLVRGWGSSRRPYRGAGGLRPAASGVRASNRNGHAEGVQGPRWTRSVRLPRPASPGSATTPCRVRRAPRRACRPWPAAAGSGRRSRPWSAPAR